MNIFKETTNNITVEVVPRFEPEKSSVQNSSFFFSYQVRIINNSEKNIQIKRRSWIITDAFFNIEYIEGEGIMGATPIIPSGKEYSYSSACPLKTSFGTMKGHYTAVDEEGNSIKINIPEFVLAHPYALQ